MYWMPRANNPRQEELDGREYIHLSLSLSVFRGMGEKGGGKGVFGCESVEGPV